MIYEYMCESCNHEWEEEQKITDERIEECPKCLEQTAKRLISGGGSFILLGSKWASSGYS